MDFAWIRTELSMQGSEHLASQREASDLYWILQSVPSLREANEPILIPDTRLDLRFKEHSIRHLLPSSLIVVPLRMGQVTHGTLYIGGKRPLEALPTQVELADLQAALVFRLHHERQHRELAREQRYGSALSQIAQSVDAEADLEELLTLTARSALEVTGAAACWIGVRGDSSETHVAFMIAPFAEDERSRIEQRFEGLLASSGGASSTVYESSPMSLDGLVRYPIRSDGDVVGHLILLFDNPGQQAEARRFAEGLCRLWTPIITCVSGKVRIERAYAETVQALVQAVDVRDHYSFGHSTRVSELASGLAAYLGAEPNEVRDVGLAGLLHDIGKLSVPETVLAKEGPLTEAEWNQVRQSPVIGARIVANIQGLQSLVPMIRHHLERFDGRGYPAGLRGREIPWGARVLAVANTFDALVNARSYRAAVSVPKAYEMLQELVGSHLDGDIVAAFIEWHQSQERVRHAEESQDETLESVRLPEDLAEPSEVLRLTVRETEVLTLIAQGMSNREIGERLGVSEKTVKNHITRLFMKLGVRDRTQAVVVALRAGVRLEGVSART